MTASVHTFVLPARDPEAPRPAWYDPRKDPAVLLDALVTTAGRHPVTVERDGLAAALERVAGSSLPDDHVAYFVEDDWVHLPGWAEALLEVLVGVGGGGQPTCEYASLQDHPDKYTSTYEPLTFLGALPSRHWRTVPHATGSFACTLRALRRDLEVHLSRPDDAFLELWRQSKALCTPVPALAAPCRLGELGPCVDWERQMARARDARRRRASRPRGASWADAD